MNERLLTVTAQAVTSILNGIDPSSDQGKMVAEINKLLARQQQTGLEPDEVDRENKQFNEGVTHTVELLARTIGAENWVAGDGSEDYDEDLAQTLLNILAAKGLYDPENAAYASTSKQIATDLLDAISYHFGEAELAKIVRHIKTANKVREDNAQIDAFEQLLAAR